jgi:hypothetical protein
VIADRRRGTEEPWRVFNGDSLLIGDVGRPDVHVAGDVRGQARLLHESLRGLLELPDHVVLLPSHYGGSVCGRGLSANPFSSVGFERAHNPMLAPYIAWVPAIPASGSGIGGAREGLLGLEVPVGYVLSDNGDRAVSIGASFRVLFTVF